MIAALAFLAGVVVGVLLTVTAYYYLSTSRAWWP